MRPVSVSRVEGVAMYYSLSLSDADRLIAYHTKGGEGKLAVHDILCHICLIQSCGTYKRVGFWGGHPEGTRALPKPLPFRFFIEETSMRADRLLSILLLLQVHQRITAGDLAKRLEVSERTIHRDMEALGAAGIPVVAE